MRRARLAVVVGEEIGNMDQTVTIVIIASLVPAERDMSADGNATRMAHTVEANLITAAIPTITNAVDFTPEATTTTMMTKMMMMKRIQM